MMNKIMHGTGGLKSETWFEMASGNARATRASADLLNVKEKHGRLELHKKQLLQCQSDQTVECHTDQHKTVGASMEVQEGLQAIQRETGACRLKAKQEPRPGRE